MSKPQLSVQNLNVFYGKQQVLKDINIDIPEKQLTVIMGPSGCGKTTMLKCFNRLIDLSDDVKVSGKILFDDTDILDSKVDVTDIRTKIGMLSQVPYPLPMSIYDNVAYGPRIHGLKDRKKLGEIVENCLKIAGLWTEVKDRLNSPASKLSMGQKQRLCLARTLSVKSKVILCDEPTSSLDPIAAQTVEEKLIELKKDYTVIVVTHNLVQAKRLADYLIFIYLGEIVDHGPINDIFTKTKEREHVMQKLKSLGYM